MPLKQARLNKLDWIDAGLRALITQGPERLKAEPLARDIGTTKGSFYWHFKDVPDFKSQLLNVWEAHISKQLSADVEANIPATGKLELLTKSMILNADSMLYSQAESAIRAWARSDLMAAATLLEIDTLRQTYVSVLLRDIGLSNPEISRAIYASLVGLNTLPPDSQQDTQSVVSTLLAAFLALAEA